MSKIEKTGFGKSFLDGLFYKNPFFVLFLGLTLVRISTTRLETALIIGVIAGIERIITQLVLGLLRKHLDKVGAYLILLPLSLQPVYRLSLAGFSDFASLPLGNSSMSMEATESS